MRQTFKLSTIAALLVSSLSGCGNLQKQVFDLEVNAKNNIKAEQEKAARPVSVVTTTTAAWLMGQSVQVMPTPSPMLTQIVTYAPTQRVALTDIAAWISQSTGLVVDTAEVQSITNDQGASLGQGQGLPSLAPQSLVMNGPGALPQLPNSQSFSPQLLSINYQGPLSGLLDIAANKSGLWWKFSNGRLMFYRTETQTFYLPAIAIKSSGKTSITTDTDTGVTSSTSPSTLSGGVTSIGQYAVDVWGELEKTAKTVGGNAQIVANPSLGSVTVTGTPTQVRNVEEWVKNLSENLSQQVSITVRIYKVKVTREDNYNWNPSVVFNSLSSPYGISLTGPQAPNILSGMTPFQLAGNVLDSATGSAAKYSGSQLAFQALSTLGRVTETMHQTVVTLNGQPAPIQVANQLTYLASTTPGAATTIGTAPVPPTLTPATLTTGFTGMFLPRIVNGKILLAMNLTSSILINMGSAGNGESNIQTPNVDTSTFPQSVILTPGDSLLLTGLQLDNGKTSQNGVGSPNNYAFGGGVGSNTGKQLIAIVITAKVL